MFKVARKSPDMINAADEGTTPGLEEAMSDLSADFAFIEECVERLSRMGVTKEKEALVLVLEMGTMITEMINKLTEAVQE